MNELQVKTVVLEPAKVEFNFNELSKMLDDQLAKYEGLEFTEKDAAECKKVIAELNKGKRALNDYRIATKKELSVSITDFEHECKELSTKFDSVIAPLKEQADEFEEKRREEKRKKVKVSVDHLIEKEGLNEKYAAQLVIENSYLNKSTTLKSIREDLKTKAMHLGIQQDKEDLDVEVIKMSVEVANERYGINLLDSTYIRLLEHECIEQIKKVITEDAEGEVFTQEKEEKLHPTIEKTSEDVFDNDEPGSFVEVYEVTGTELQLDALEEYMSSNGITWEVIEDD